MVFGPIVILATKTPNAAVTPPVKLSIFIFVAIKPYCLLPIFLNIVRGIMLKEAPPSTKTFANVLPFIWALTYKDSKCLVISGVGLSNVILTLLSTSSSPIVAYLVSSEHMSPSRLLFWFELAQNSLRIKLIASTSWPSKSSSFNHASNSESSICLNSCFVGSSWVISYVISFCPLPSKIISISLDFGLLSSILV